MRNQTKLYGAMIMVLGFIILTSPIFLAVFKIFLESNTSAVLLGSGFVLFGLGWALQVSRWYGFILSVMFITLGLSVIIFVAMPLLR